MSLAMFHASGEPREMGRVHGQALAGEIGDALAFYDSLDGDRARTGYESLPAYLDVAREHVPHLVEEMIGIAEGADRALEEVAFLNCLEEVFEFEACTTIVTSRFLIHAEQWYSGHAGLGLVVAVPGDAPAFVGPTCAGVLPAVGLNASGFAQGIDSLYATDDRVGIPRVLVSSLALRASSLTEAIAAASIDPRAGGYAHVLAAMDDAVVVETSATSVRALDGVLAHTNHCLSQGLPVREPSPGSLSRLDRAKELLDQHPPTTVEAAIAIVADHEGSPQSICHHGSTPVDTSTIFGMVCDLLTGVVCVSAGQPCEASWREVTVPGYAGRETRHVG